MNIAKKAVKGLLLSGRVSRAAVKRSAIGLGIVLLINLGVLGLLAKNALDGLQTYATDQMMTNASNRAIFPYVVIAAIDDKTLAAYGRLDSWDRTHYADLINRLKAYNVADIVFDYPFSDATPNDAKVAQAIQNAMHPSDKTDPIPVLIGVWPNGEPTLVSGQGLQFESFQSVSPAIAATDAIKVSAAVDTDGSYVRRVPFVSLAGQQRLFALPLEAVNSGLGNGPLAQFLKFGKGAVQYGKVTIPVDQYNRLTLSYFGRPGAFLSFSFVDIAAGRVNPNFLKNNIVLVGPHNGTGLADNYPVPTSVQGNSKMDSVEIWANAVQDLLLARFVTYQGAGSTFGLALGFSLLAALVFLRFGAWGWLPTLLLAGGYTVLKFVQTSQAFLALPPKLGSDQEQIITVPNVAYVDLALLLSAAVLFVYLFVQEQRSRGQIYEMFGRYVTPAVAQQLASMDASGELKLGGSRREATIMFAELRGIGAVHDGHSPTAVLEMLNRYFDQAVKIIIDHGGTINKFIGEDVMVMFNVPLDLPGHAIAACKAAFEAQQWVANYRGTRGETAAFGIGINSGTLVAGNMGSQDRMEFTVIGDTVNVASRLNGVAKLDDVIISQATLDRLEGSGAQVVDRGEILVKGRQEPVHCYKLVGFADGGPVQIVGREEVAATPATTH